MSAETTRGRFDPREGVDYGKCGDCGVGLATSADAVAHRKETMSPGRSSHRTRSTNPDREERIQSHVDDVIEDAITSALDNLRRDVDRGDVTEEEITEALSWHSDFADAWKEN